jgi:molybdopterin converting factor small subunit
VAVNIKLNLPLKEMAGNRAVIGVNGATVAACLDDLIARLPGARPQIYNEDGSAAVLILLNNEPLPGQDPGYPVRDGDELWLLTVLSGG